MKYCINHEMCYYIIAPWQLFVQTPLACILSVSLFPVPNRAQVNACSTFNVLNAEDRRVAAALLQLSPEEESILSK